MKIAVVQFPGSNCDADTLIPFKYSLGIPADFIWHKEESLGDADAVILPGGFSYGDYLRCGAIARFSPVMKAIRAFADNGGAVLGICNGFQVLCESGLLPGALISNSGLEFRCITVGLKVEDSSETFNRKTIGAMHVRVPIAHQEGNYRIDEAGLAELEANKQVLLRYTENPNGALNDIAAIRNKRGNVWGMMPHPERAVEDFHPSQDGLPILKAFLANVAASKATSAA